MDAQAESQSGGWLRRLRQTRERVFAAIVEGSTDITAEEERRLFVSSVLNGVDSDFNFLNLAQRSKDQRDNPQPRDNGQKQDYPASGRASGNRY